MRDAKLSMIKKMAVSYLHIYRQSETLKLLLTTTTGWTQITLVQQLPLDEYHFPEKYS